MKILSKLLIGPEDLKPSHPDFSVEGVFNPAAARLPDKGIVLYARVAEKALPTKDGAARCPVVASEKGYKIRYLKVRKSEIRSEKGNTIYLKNGKCRLLTISHLRRVILDKSGLKVVRKDKKPSFTGTGSEGQYGVEDPRITSLNGLYAMTYVSVSIKEGVSTSLAFSKNLVKWERKGIIFREQNKDVVIFPERINRSYVALHRPEGSFEFSSPSIWISHSPDLVYWGREKSIIQTREGSWDSERVGAGTPPVKTDGGWLLIYHGVEKKADAGRVYSAGALLLSTKNPAKVIARSPKDEPLIGPEEEHERNGFVENVVFPTGAIVDENKKDLLIYSGGADRVVSAKKIKIKEILNHLEHY